MKTRWFLICALLLSSIALGNAAVGERTAKASEGGGLWCKNLVNCNGEAGCPSGGSLTGCVISCTNGGEAVCNIR